MKPLCRFALVSGVLCRQPEDLRDEVPHGPDPARYVEAVQKFVDAGFDHVVLLQAGHEQEAFLRFFENELAPLLRAADGRRKTDIPRGRARRERSAHAS